MLQFFKNRIIIIFNIKEFENFSVEKKTLSTALRFEPRFFDCRSTEISYSTN